METNLTRTLTPQELAVRRELEETLAEINAQIEAELAKLMPILGDKTTAILAMELDINPSRLSLQERVR